MTAEDLARLLHARKTGKRRWTAKCPGHPDRHPSLQIAEGRKGVLLKCMSNGCETKAILDAMGLRWGDLFYGSDLTLEIRARLAEDKKLERLERRFGLVLVLLAIDKPRRKYWHEAARRIGAARRELRERRDPELKRAREFQERVKRVGMDEVWREFLASDLGSSIDRQYGRRAMALKNQDAVLRQLRRLYDGKAFAKDGGTYKVVGYRKDGKLIQATGPTWDEALKELAGKVQRG